MPNLSSPMNYTQLLTYLEDIIQDQAPSADFSTIIPAAIQDAEQRIYRDLDFLATRTIDSTGTLTPTNREFVLPTSNVTFLVLQGVSLITPANEAFGTGKQNILEECSLDMLDFTWPDPSVTGLPSKWAMKNDSTIVVAKTPDQAYPVALTGTFRPASMSATNLTSYIGNIYPDLLLNACMGFMAGYQRDYGSQSDDPKLAMSWETKYQAALKTALLEEQRRKGTSIGWSPFAETEATPPRT